MNCPNCGAALELLPGRTHLRCPYCTSLAFPEPVEEGVVVLGGDHPHDCPACHKRLAAAALDGERVGYCEGCRGILFSSDQFARAVARRRDAQPDRDRATEPIDLRELRRVLRCVRCGRRMDTHVYGGGGNAVIDTCEPCRLVWLDAGELTLLGRYVPARSGGPAVWDEQSAAPLEEILRHQR
jgi:Zn-finger nucleic acid-binding protein